MGRCLDKAKRITFHQPVPRVAKNTCHFADKISLRSGLLHRGNTSAATRKQLKRHRAGAGKQVKRLGGITLEVDQILQHIEDILAGEIGSWPRHNICGHIESAAPVFSSDYSHFPVILIIIIFSLASYLS